VVFVFFVILIGGPCRGHFVVYVWPGAPKFKCARGTNDLEGYHLHVEELLSAVNASPELVILLVQEYTYRWNLQYDDAPLKFFFYLTAGFFLSLLLSS